MMQAEQMGPMNPYKELVGIAGYINTDGQEITLGELVGQKVILVDIWTYSCINCQRTLPYITSWYDTYRDRGLEIVGVHSPEFDFEKDIENVERAVDKWGIKYPVVLDNDFATWRAYNNRYWPRKYLIDIHGNIVYDHIGEGGYAETEKKIKELLQERAELLGEVVDMDESITTPEGVEVVDPSGIGSPETYFGTLRHRYPTPVSVSADGVATFEAPETIELNTLYLVGDWRLTGEYAEAVSPDAKIIFKYRSEKVFLVASAEDGGDVSVMRDGAPIGQAGGEHVFDDVFHVQEDQLYRIVEDPTGSGEYTLELIIKDPGVRVFAFTFG
jgi:thiol-disulfide isomerase/thioredoxin